MHLPNLIGDHRFLAPTSHISQNAPRSLFTFHSVGPRLLASARMAVSRDHSSYYFQLLALAAHRYDGKIYVIGNLDPYIIVKDYFHADVGTWPHSYYMDIVDYLVYITRFITQEERRAKKGLHSYRYFITTRCKTLESCMVQYKQRAAQS